MPEQVQCPSCLQKLRVPDTLLGKKVKCPKCSTVFEAKGKQETEDEEGGSYVFEPAPVPEPKKKPLRKMSDDDESDEDEADEGEERRPKKNKRRHNAEALKKVSTPATGLQVTAILTIIAGLIFLPLTFSSSLQQRIIPKVANQQPPEGASTTAKVWNGISFFISLLIQIAIIRGAGKMKRLESYRESLITSILCCLPVCTCCFTGVPFAIWSLVVINSPDVRPFFKE
jgi:predicted Zn finger-like uncharacterized protein